MINEQFKFEDDDEKDFNLSSIVKVKRIRSVNSFASLAEHFKKELKSLDLEELMTSDTSIEHLVEKIQQLKPNTIVLKNNDMNRKSYLIVETEIILGECLAIRNNKVLVSGDYHYCQQGICAKIKAEYPNKFDMMNPEDLDDLLLRNFSEKHHNNKNFYRIINLEN